MGDRPRSGRDAALELSPEEFRAAGRDLIDRLAAFLAALPDQRVAPGASRAEVQAAMQAGRTLPAAPEPVGALVAEAAELLFARSTFNGHPRFFGYITSSAAPVGALADLLASVVNPNVGAWSLSPTATEIELQTVRWIAELLGFPTSCGGLLVSGGNMANFVCALVAIREKAPWDLRRRGVAAGAPLAIYASAETHTWIDKAADMSGLGTDAIRRVTADAEGRIRPDALRARIAEDRRAGVHPLFVVATSGSVSTGIVDPIIALGAICREESLWLHVDGAYGAPAAALPDAPEDLKALAIADSIAVDPHKWLYAPLEAGCVLVRDAEALHRAFWSRPPYYHFEGDADDPPVNLYEWGPQNSRGFRALKVWLGLRQAGREGLVRSIATDVELARSMYRHVERHPELEAATCALSITTFRYVPPDLRDRAYADERVAVYLDELNTAVLTATQEGGAVYLSNAVVHGRFLLRACIVNFRTSEHDVAAVPEIVAAAGRRLDAELRPRVLRAAAAQRAGARRDT